MALNVDYDIDEANGILTIHVNLKEEQGRSKSGKTIVVASTQGNINVDGRHFLGLNVYKYPE
jgi:hypothetical protein